MTFRSMNLSSLLENQEQKFFISTEGVKPVQWTLLSLTLSSLVCHFRGGSFDYLETNILGEDYESQ